MIDTPNTTRAALYLRASSEGQVENSIPAQRERCEQHAAEQGWTLVAEFTDEGISAFKDVARPGLDGVRASAERGEFDRLIVWNTDRLTRKSGKQGLLALRWELEGLGVTIASVTQPDIEDTFAAEIMALVEGARAHGESAAKSVSVSRGMEQRAKRGGHNGRVAYGYQSKDGQLIPDPDRAPIIRRIFREFAAGETQSAIARGLETDGVPTARDGKNWHQATIRQYLLNPTYRGAIPFKGELIEDAHEAIIDPELWAAVQASPGLSGASQREGGTGSGVRNRGRTAGAHLLSRLLACGECSQTMSARLGELRKDGTRYATYTCPRHAGKLAGTCAMPPVPREQLDRAVLDHFTQHVMDVEATRAAFERNRDAAIKQTDAELAALRSVVAGKRAAFERVEGDYLSGTITADQWSRFDDRLSGEVANAEAAVLAAEGRLEAVREAQDPDIEAKVTEALTALGEAVRVGLSDGGAVAALRAQLGQVFDHFILMRDTIYPAGSSPPEGLYYGETHDDLDAERPFGVPGMIVLPVLQPEVVNGIEYDPVARRVPLEPAALQGDHPRQNKRDGLARTYFWPHAISLNPRGPQ